MAETDTTLLSTSGIADLLGVSASTVRKWADTKVDFPAPCAGLTKRTRRWNKAAIVAWRDRRAAEVQRNPAATVAGKQDSTAPSSDE
jgi:predicted DNA-binding transcriptional regulator AlpA